MIGLLGLAALCIEVIYGVLEVIVNCSIERSTERRRGNRAVFSEAGTTAMLTSTSVAAGPTHVHLRIVWALHLPL